MNEILRMTTASELRDNTVARLEDKIKHVGKYQNQAFGKGTLYALREELDYWRHAWIEDKQHVSVETLKQVKAKLAESVTLQAPRSE